MAKVKELCQEKLKSTIEELGFELVDVEYVKEFDGMNLIFTIDKDGGVGIEDCEKVSKVIDPILDELNPTGDQAYTLVVSSPGLDRPLSTNRDFDRTLGKEVTLTLFAKVNGQKAFEGILKSYTENNVTIEVNGEDMTFERNKIANIKLVIKF